jgi:hypothetical protein
VFGGCLEETDCPGICRPGGAELEPDRVVELAPDIVAPSDICVHPDGVSMLIVSDNGSLFHTDEKGAVHMRSPFEGGDFM